MENEILPNDVLFMKNLVGKHVAVKTVDNVVQEGTIFVIDPIYKSIILIDSNDEKKLKLILYHAVVSLDVLSDEIKQNFVRKPMDVTEESQILVRKKRLLRWLRHMFISVEDHDTHLQVEDHLRIAYPFQIEDCFCENTIVLDRITNIINLMPESFE